MKFVLFGTGEPGARHYNRLKSEYNIVCFADNDPGKQGRKLLSLDIINPNDIAELGLSVIISAGFHIRLQIIKQLFDMGVKCFYIPEDNKMHVLKYIDLSAYIDLSEKPNKVCVLRREHAGVVSSALIKNNPFTDMEIVSIDDRTRDDNYYYHYLTSSLIIKHFAEDIRNKKSIELWHGFTIKAIGLMNCDDNDIHFAKYVQDSLSKRSVICSLSKLYSIFFGYCCGVPYEEFFITGYPRNDTLFSANGREMLLKLLGPIKQKRVAIYLPTYRVDKNNSSANGSCSFIFNLPDFHETDFNEYLKKNDILFLFKMHSLEAALQVIRETEHIKMITDAMLDNCGMDLYEILNGTDCLISDYSSVIIDYLLTDKPMIFTPTDLEEYSETRGLMTEPYDSWMPGEIAVTYDCLKSALYQACYGDDIYKRDRERLKRITHKFHDAKSSERVLSLARDIMGI